jgi:hypothetical protein
VESVYSIRRSANRNPYSGMGDLETSVAGGVLENSGSVLRQSPALAAILEVVLGGRHNSGHSDSW